MAHGVINAPLSRGRLDSHYHRAKRKRALEQSPPHVYPGFESMRLDTEASRHRLSVLPPTRTVAVKRKGISGSVAEQQAIGNSRSGDMTVV